MVVSNYQITGKVQLRETAKNVLDEYSEQRKEDKETWLSKKSKLGKQRDEERRQEYWEAFNLKKVEKEKGYSELYVSL